MMNLVDPLNKSLKPDYDAAEASKDYETFLYNQVLDIIRIRNIIKRCDKTIKQYFQKMIPEYARILSKGDNREKERIEKKLMTYSN